MLKRNFFYVILSVLLTVAVTDYIWVELIHEDDLVAELETEKEKEAEEELRELEIKENKLHSSENYILYPLSSIQSINLYSGFVKHGNSFELLNLNLDPPLFIQFQQLLLHC